MHAGEKAYIKKWRPPPKTLEPHAHYTGRKEKSFFLIYKEIQTGTVAKSYMRKGFLMYKEMRKYVNHIPSNAHISTPFFSKQCFSLKYVLVAPPSKFWRFV